MKIKCLLLFAIILTIASVGFAQTNNDQASAVKRLGVFTNMKFTQEHQYGYTIELWQEKDRVFGYFLSSEGLAGDTPTGLLEDAAFDPKTGTLSFRTRLSKGMTFDKNNKEIPSRDVYQFKGSLKNQKLAGILEYKNALAPSAKVEKTNVSLQKSKSQSAEMSKAKSYDEWKTEADSILKLRGPKW